MFSFSNSTDFLPLHTDLNTAQRGEERAAELSGGDKKSQKQQCRTTTCPASSEG